jgi:chromosome segregation ATPase
MRASDRVRRLVFAAAIAFCGIAGLSAAVAQSDDSTARLRAALRQATVRLRELEDQNANLQAKQSELERDRLAATQKAAENEKGLSALRGQAASSRAALERAAEAQKENLAKWERAYKDATDTARTRDADAKRLEAALTNLREQNRATEAKNAELYRLGQELLKLYDSKDMFDVLRAGEPITGLKRVEYENLMQDYDDKLRANRVVHPEPR